MGSVWLTIGKDGGNVVSQMCHVVETLRVWDVESGVETRVCFHKRGVNAVALSPDDQRAYSIGHESAMAWDLASGKSIWDTPVADGGYGLAVSPDGRYVACSYVNTFILDAESGAPLRVLSFHRYVVDALAFTVDGRYLISHPLTRHARSGTPQPGAESESLPATLPA